MKPPTPARRTDAPTHRMTVYFEQDDTPPTRRLFTPDQANRTLPLVRRIIADLREEHTAAKRLHDELCNVPLMDRGRRRQIGRRITRKVCRLERLVEEVRCIGADVADYRTATVEFAALIDDRPAVLSWRPGESRVQHWRDPSVTEDQRKPLTTG
ncbi:MAG: DUF2203 family protein [Planctomycetota bacterium]